MKTTYTVESVTSGHPDKICDQISDAILDHYLAKDPYSRVAVETFGSHNLLVIGGEVTSKAEVDAAGIARDLYKEIGYDDSLSIITNIAQQSPDIAQGVDTGGAGDQGIVYGYATNETAEYLPQAVTIVHKLTKGLEKLRREDPECSWLGPDGKAQVTMQDGHIKAVLVSCQHAETIAQEEIKDALTKKLIQPLLGDLNGIEILVNPTGKFTVGGFTADTGLTGRKLMVDSYGGLIPHGGGAFCVAGHSLINTADGLEQIKDMASAAKERRLVKTDIHPHPIGGWYNNGEKETLKIITNHGYTLEGTPNHRIRVLNNSGKYTWKRLEKIKKGDYVAIHRKNRLSPNSFTIPPFKYTYQRGTAEGRKNIFSYPTYINEDYGYLMGLLIGDGNCMMDGAIAICACEKDQLSNIQKLFQKLFGKKGKIFGHWAYMGGVELRAFLCHLGIAKKRSWEKEVPWIIYKSPQKVISAFLRGLYDTDGSIRFNGRNKNTADIIYYSTSYTLVSGVQQLLLNFGIISGVGIIDHTGKPFIIEGKKRVSRRPEYVLRIVGSYSKNIFKKKIGFCLKRKQRVLNLLNLEDKRDYSTIPHQHKHIRTLWNLLTSREHQQDRSKVGRFLRKVSDKSTKELTYEKLGEFLHAHYEQFLTNKIFNYLFFLNDMHLFYDPIKKIENSIAHTFDLYVPDVHTFTANGFVCHNSGKDPTKVDRSAAYMARFAAKNIVANGLAKECTVSVAYAIGRAEPLMVHAETDDGRDVGALVREKFDFRPKAIIERLNLRTPIYRKTAAYGHFGREGLPWEEVVEI